MTVMSHMREVKAMLTEPRRTQLRNEVLALRPEERIRIPWCLWSTRHVVVRAPVDYEGGAADRVTDGGWVCLDCGTEDA